MRFPSPPTLLRSSIGGRQNELFATLVLLTLSLQTKDEVTDAAVDELRAALGGTHTLERFLSA